MARFSRSATGLEDGAGLGQAKSNRGIGAKSKHDCGFVLRSSNCGFEEGYPRSICEPGGRRKCIDLHATKKESRDGERVAFDDGASFGPLLWV